MWKRKFHIWTSPGLHNLLVKKLKGLSHFILCQVISKNKKQKQKLSNSGLTGLSNIYMEGPEGVTSKDVEYQGQSGPSGDLELLLLNWRGALIDCRNHIRALCPEGHSPGKTKKLHRTFKLPPMFAYSTLPLLTNHSFVTQLFLLFYCTAFLNSNPWSLHQWPTVSPSGQNVLLNFVLLSSLKAYKTLSKMWGIWQTLIE